jgi:hypothetical protein
MNNHIISLQSNNTTTQEVLSGVDLFDHTQITLSLQNIYNKTIPVFVKIDWGDGVVETIDNNLYNFPDRTDVNIFNPNPILNNTYLHEYYPSPTSLYISYSLQVLIYYSTGDYSLFIIPLTLRTNNFFEVIGDINLVGVNILPESLNPKQYQLKSIINDQIIEIVDVY